MASEDAPSHPTEWVLTGLAAGIDRAAVFLARVVIDRTVMPPPDATDSLRASASFYVRPDLADDPRRFFSFLDRPQPVPAVVTLHRHSVSDGGDRIGLAFASPYRPANPDYTQRFDERLENHTVHAEMWRHPPGSSRGTIVALHGFGMGNPRFDAIALMVPGFFRAGYDVALLTLPLHGARTPRDARFSGQLLAAPGVSDLNESVAQAVHDTVALLAWLRERTTAPIGLLGLSLGGYVAALMAGLCSDLDFVIPIVAPVCLGDLAHRFMVESGQYRSRSDAALTREEFQAAYRVHSPLTYAPRLPPERLLIVAGRGDRIVRPEHATWLGAHWGTPEIVWFTGSHIAPFGRGMVQDRIRAFLVDVTSAHARAKAEQPTVNGRQRLRSLTGRGTGA
jgi:pimeloyl-ACP methyl ester carboxylesterase